MVRKLEVAVAKLVFPEYTAYTDCEPDEINVVERTAWAKFEPTWPSVAVPRMRGEAAAA